MFNLDVDFTPEQIKHLETLSNSELEGLMSACEMEVTKRNTAQQAKKILINALYGSMGSNHFRFYSLTNAAAVTTFGQLAIQWIERNLNEYMSKITGEKDYVIAIDTDSVVGSTLIDVNGKKMTISDFYDSVSDENLVRDLKDDTVKVVTASTSLGCTVDGVVRKPINYVMRHKVKKRMFRITVAGKSVEVTEDHSVIVKRNGVLLSVKPLDIKKTDKLITL